MKQKVYITKYSLSKGILEKEARVSDLGYGRLRAFCNGDYSSYGIGSEAFYTLEEALNNAEEQRIKKIESLKKQIKKLETLKIEVK